MRTMSRAALVAAVLAAGLLQLSAAETARLRHLASIYVDENGAGLRSPEGVACDGSGRLVVGDTGNDRLVRFTYQDRALGGGSEIKIPELSAPSRIQLNSKGEIYAFDQKQRRIVHLGEDGAFRNVVSFDGVPPPSTVVPKSFKIDTADNLYVLDVFSARVLVLDAEGRFQKALPIPDDAGFVTDVAVDLAGNVLLLDAVKRRVLSTAREAGAFTALGGDPSLTTMPVYLAENKGTIFVVEGSGSSIVALGQDGTFLTRQLTLGWTDGALRHPSQICVNDKDEMFVADRDNSRVQVFGLMR